MIEGLGRLESLLSITKIFQCVVLDRAFPHSTAQCYLTNQHSLCMSERMSYRRQSRRVGKPSYRQIVINEKHLFLEKEITLQCRQIVLIPVRYR